MASVVCVHGLGGSAATMAPLVEALRQAGHDADAITLPGHGTTPDELDTVTWREWLDAVPPADVVVGQSLGAAIALAVATERPQVRAVVAINPPAPDPDALEGLQWRRSRGHEWVDGPPLADGEPGYTRLPIAALITMTAGILAIDLAAVTVPVLIVTSALDDVVDPASADAVAAVLAGPVHRLVLPNSGHVATLGPDRDLLANGIADLRVATGQW